MLVYLFTLILSLVLALEDSLYLRMIRSFENNLSMKDAVASGIQLALEHCQQQFKWDPWNCPESYFSRQGRRPATRETAFVQAITGAGVVYIVTRRCSMGELDCGCVRRVRGRIVEPDDGDWLWSGCSDNVNVGITMTREYFDVALQRMDPWTFMNLHNIDAGYEAVRGCLVLRCKCHGISGSCTTKICWKELCPFKRIADKIRYRYDRAIRLETVETNIENWINSAAYKPEYNTPEVSSQELVYVMDSPNYCHVDNESGWPGTRGRTCSRDKSMNITSNERHSCRVLCRACGYRVKRRLASTLYHCNCTFHWCCRVTCKLCSNKIEQFYCQ